MTISAVDRGASLLLVDLQQGTLANPRLLDPEGVVRNAQRLATAFRSADLDVVHIVFDPKATPPGRTQLGGKLPAMTGFTDPIPALRPVPGEATVVKGGWSAFSNPELVMLLRERHVTQVVITGIATTFGVESTARDAYDAGFNVVVVSDAVTDMTQEAHVSAFARVFPVLGETATTDEVLGLVRLP